MNRVNSIAAIRICALGLAVVCLLVCVTVDSFAGDGDGIFGYSMRLKNKDFTTDDGSGQNLVVGANQERTSALPQLPAPVTNLQQRNTPWIFGQLYVWFGMWPR